MPGGTLIYGPNCLKGVVRGDVEQGFAEADVVTEGTFGYENIPNALPPESVGAIALWEEPNKVTIWVTSQAPYMDKVTLFHVFNRQIEVRSIGGPCGGSFGSKFMSWQVQSYAILLSRATGRPVKLIFTKEEHMAAFVLRVGSRMHARVGMKKDGTVTAIQGTWLVDTGYYSFTTQAQVAIGSRRAHDHGPVSQLGPEEYRGGHQPERVRHHTGLRRSGAEMLFYTASVPCHGEGRTRPLRGAQEEFRQARRRVFLAGWHLVYLQGSRLLQGHGQGRRALRLEGEMEGLAHSRPR